MRVSPHVTTITLGRRSPGRLDATYPHTPGAPSTCAYLVLLRVEIARFTQTELARLCCSNPHLRVLRLVGGQPLAATLPYAVRTFLQCSVSRIAPAVVWRASRLDYRRKAMTQCFRLKAARQFFWKCQGKGGAVPGLRARHEVTAQNRSSHPV